MSALEQVIGHTFRDPSLLQLALTHGSVGYENQRPQADNQRLEFLGDAVLQLALSHLLYSQQATADEGVLTKARAQLVSTKALARLARQMGLGTYLIMGRGEEANGGRERESALADALEAVAGAVYLDAGTDAAHAFATRLFSPDLRLLERGPLERNPKGELQEMIQALSTLPAQYDIVGEEGPDHAKSFVSAVSWLGSELGKGSGRSKKEAETQAAQAALDNPGLAEVLRTNWERVSEQPPKVGVHREQP